MGLSNKKGGIKNQSKSNIDDSQLKIILLEDEYSQYLQVKKNKEKFAEKGLGMNFPPEDSNFDFMSRQESEEGNFTKALRYSNASILLNPKLEYYELRAQIKRDLDDIEGAIEDYNICINMTPNEGNLYKHRGILKVALEDYSGAYEDMIKAGTLLADGVTPELISELRELSEK
ncbi:hypothetical protein HN014_13310 [Aquimarina sp. TRL1]|uniref:hypothetical protein n=1 Tax=Aquimarina sp. (strain TRL1) TaxID=2736252 RepID=UPI00158A3BAB|nr:hypothetical protein [Aquimarina sp. TRL1]QKX05844.1 hypothetical protein HN014_13310 [Aquimarina sp. TRL1]